MKRLTQEDIALIRQQANIVDVISSYIPLTQAGSNYKAICPFHDDHDPSMSINVSKQIYKCFVCGQGGNVFGFVRDYEQISFIESVIKVGQMVGFDFSDYSIESYKPKIDERLNRLYNLMNDAQLYLEYSLNNSKDMVLTHFLESRGLSPQIIESFRIGYSDPQYSLVNYLTKKGHQIDELIKVNLAHESGQDVFSGRVVFPIANTQNQVVGYTARALGQQSAKYINSAETVLFKKSQILYNYPQANQAKLKSIPLILCEGVMDVIAFSKANLQKAVATLGTALSDEQIQLIKRMNTSVILAFDPDEAGMKATMSIGNQLRQNQIEVQVLNNDTTLDPDEVISKHSASRLLAMVEKPQHYLEFLMSALSKLYGLNSYDSRKKIVELMIVQLQQEDQLDRQYFMKQLSELTKFNLSMIEDLIQQRKEPQAKPKVYVPNQKPTVQALKSEKDVLAHLLSGKSFANEFKLKLGYLLDKDANELALLITNLYNSRDKIEIADCLDLNINQSQQELLLELSDSGVYQYDKNMTQFREAMTQVALADLEHLVKLSQRKLNQSLEMEEKLKIIQEQLSYQQQIDKLKNGGLK